MTCSACAAGVEAALRAVPGVVGAVVGYPDGKAVVETTTAGAPSDDALVEAVERAGYRARIPSPTGAER